MPLENKTTCSFAYIDSMGEENYHDATFLAQVMLERFGDVLRHHEMMLTVNLRRENIAAALENCNELISYGQLKGGDTAEYESHRETLMERLRKTRTFLAAQLWDEVNGNLAAAPKHFAATPLVVAGEAHCQVNAETDAVYLVFYVRGEAERKIACRLAASEKPFLVDLDFPARVTVHGYFLSATGALILLHPCRFLNSFETPWQ